MEAIENTDDDLELVDVLASDFIARYREGDRPTVDEYAKRHPELGDAIRRMFPLVASIERIKITEQVTEDGSATLAGRLLLQLGDFRIGREIGRGGMGIVFEAYQESLDRTVAIKVLPRQSLLDDESLERFRMEATTAASMHHMNIVPIYGTGECDGSYYLVMQLIDGKSLDSLIASGSKTDCADAARIGQQIADAIAYSHSNGVLHRDIKPANILIEKDGTAQVTDFGLARNVGDDLTDSRTVSGSLRYMAPERFSGISGEAGDIYGIGITLYELLSGIPAFEATSAEHLIGSITDARIKPIGTVRVDVPIDLATIVGKAIHADAAQRYSSALELRDDLRRFLNDEPIKARRISVWGRLIRWIKRNPKLAAATGTAAFAMVAATIISTIAFVFTAAANQRSVDALQSSEQTVDLALQSLNGVVDVVSQIPGPTTLTLVDEFDDDDLFPNVSLEPSPTSAKVLERLQPIYERLTQQSPTRSDIVLQRVDSSIQLARIQHSLGRTADSQGTLKSSISLLQERGQPAPISNQDLQLRLARLNNELGILLASDFLPVESMQCFEAAIEAASQVKASSPAGQTELARAHLNLGDRPRQIRRGESFTAEQREDDLHHIRQSVQILEDLRNSQRQTKTTNILYANSLSARSRLATVPHDKRKDVRAAVSVLREQLTATPDDSAVRFELVSTLADVHLRGQRSRRQTEETAVRLREALQELKTLRSAQPDNTVYLSAEVHLRHKLSAIARTQFRLNDARNLLSEAIQLQTTLLKIQPEDIQHLCWRAMLYRSQATLYRATRQPDDATTAIENAQKDLKAIAPEFTNHPLVLRTAEAVQRLTAEADVEP